ncbi:Cyclic nucleotide-binding protein [Pseudocohnilembus persalinus]|uniref:Cyclic nucleotide-binding protein n=1 Tax=Pseudocohnilembus persalinus TaxID=266149 RepID=A0A0V0QF24_PSEPJ|nr:Cyclic nucleotide-binding protein [Pseudocohnilembus persalinus]|eukprot:KRX00744.1 Cyclic nucleotide-binding protein [Pseudocohnilembus persalinus]
MNNNLNIKENQDSCFNQSYQQSFFNQSEHIELANIKERKDSSLLNISLNSQEIYDEQTSDLNVKGDSLFSDVKLKSSQNHGELELNNEKIFTNNQLNNTFSKRNLLQQSRKTTFQEIMSPQLESNQYKNEDRNILELKFKIVEQIQQQTLAQNYDKLVKLYALNTIGIIVQEINKKQKNLKTQRQIVYTFFVKQNIPEHLRERITQYFDFIHKQEASLNLEENQNALYAIVKGSIYIQDKKTHENKVLKIQQLKTGDTFGELQFFTGIKNQFQISTEESSRVLILKRNDFINILHKYPKDFEKFCYIRDQLSFSGKFHSLKYLFINMILKIKDECAFFTHKCILCKEEGHRFQNCKKVFYTPQIKQVIYEYYNLNASLRSSYPRTPDRTYSAKFYKESAQECAYLLLNQKNEDSQFENILYEHCDIYAQNQQEYEKQEIKYQQQEINEEIKQIDNEFKNFKMGRAKGEQLNTKKQQQISKLYALKYVQQSLAY